jgi:hypothetical protein
MCNFPVFDADNHLYEAAIIGGNLAPIMKVSVPVG